MAVQSRFFCRTNCAPNSAKFAPTFWAVLGQWLRNQIVWSSSTSSAKPFSNITPLNVELNCRGGLSNLIFLCELPGVQGRNGAKCDQVLLRIYCNAEMESRLVSESVVFSLLAERKFGPALYGVFNDGRIEEFILVLLPQSINKKY